MFYTLHRFTPHIHTHRGSRSQPRESRRCEVKDDYDEMKREEERQRAAAQSVELVALDPIGQWLPCQARAGEAGGTPGDELEEGGREGEREGAKEDYAVLQ